MKFLVILLIISVIALVFYIHFEYCCFDIRNEECMRKWDIYGNVQFICRLIFQLTRIFILIVISLNFIYDIIKNKKEQNKEKRKFNTKITFKRLLLGMLFLVIIRLIMIVSPYIK